MSCSFADGVELKIVKFISVCVVCVFVTLCFQQAAAEATAAEAQAKAKETRRLAEKEAAEAAEAAAAQAKKEAEAATAAADAEAAAREKKDEATAVREAGEDGGDDGEEEDSEAFVEELKAAFGGDDGVLAELVGNLGYYDSGQVSTAEACRPGGLLHKGGSLSISIGEVFLLSSRVSYELLALCVSTSLPAASPLLRRVRVPLPPQIEPEDMWAYLSETFTTEAQVTRTLTSCHLPSAVRSSFCWHG